MTLILGLGIIGSRVADQLTSAGHPLKTWNRTPKDRADSVDDPTEAAKKSHVIVSYLKDEVAVRELFERIRPSLDASKTFMNHSTIDVETTLWLDQQCREIGCDFLDAPFTGSRDASATGNLVYYVAGEAPVLEKHRAFLEISSKAIVYLGAAPAATVVKITTNLVSASAVQALTEALEISRRHGVDPRAWHEAAQLNGCYAMVHRMKIPTLLENDFTPHFSTDNMRKDTRYAFDLALQAGLHTPLNLETLQQLDLASESFSEEDFSALAKNHYLEEGIRAAQSTAKIRVTGPDSERYLNGQLSNDVCLEEGKACLLNAKGQLEIFLSFKKDGDDFLIEIPHSLREATLARLDKYLIADDVELIDESEQSPEPWELVEETSRIRDGIPKWPNELFPGLLPPEAGLEDTAISYTKGCYTGQEVISRMKRAGKTNKHLVKLTLDKPLIPSKSKLLCDGKEAGWITSVATQKDGKEIALGYRLRKFENTTQFDVQSPSSLEIIAQATIRS